MRAQKRLVERYLNWEQLQDRLRRFPNIAGHFPERVFRECSQRSPFYCHYVAWRLGTWRDEKVFACFDRALGTVSQLPNWKKEFQNFANECEFAKYWSLLWQMQVARFFAERGEVVSWTGSGPDLLVDAKEGKFYVECYSYLRSFGLEEFVRELFHFIDPSIRVRHRSYLPFSLPKDHHYVETFLHELFSPCLDTDYLARLHEQAKDRWPVLLMVPEGVKNFFVYIEGDIARYDSSVLPNFSGDPDSYLADAVQKAVRNKRERNDLQNHRPNVVAVNYAVSKDYLPARRRATELSRFFPSVECLDSLDAVLFATCGIEDDLTEVDVYYSADRAHPLRGCLARYGLVSSE